MFAIFVSDHTAGIVHWYLIAGDVLATWAVGIGILWEGEAISVSHEMAKKLVLWGVVLETVCSITLFGFDEGISRAQQSTIEAQQDKIIALETRLAPRVLSKEQIDELHILRGKIPALSFMASPDSEPAFFSAQLQAVLKDDGGIDIVPHRAPPDTRYVGTQICLPKPEVGNRSADTLLVETFSKIGPKPGICSFDQLGLSVPKDVPFIIIGERPFAFSDAQIPSSVRITIYPDAGKQK